MNKYALSFLLLVLSAFHACAYDYFKDKPNFIRENLKKDKYAIDTSAAAIVLYEDYDYEIEFNTNVEICKTRKIIKILKNSGLDKADVSITVPRSSKYFSDVKKLSGTTYNLENDRFIETPLDGDEVYKSTGKIYKIKKFSMPAVRVGSIIDYTVVTETPIRRRLCDWIIQGDIPKLYSELDLYYPTYVEVVTQELWLPNFKYIEKEYKETNLPDYYTTQEQVQQYVQKKWVAKNIAAAHDEPFLFDLDNYTKQMQVYIKGFISSYGVADDIYDTWDKVDKSFYKSDEFYKAINTNSDLLITIDRGLVGTDTDKVSIAKKIFEYVRDSIRKTDEGDLYVRKSVSKVLDEKSGNQAEINIVLISMLQTAGIACEPAILSTRDNGRLSIFYPDPEHFNYTVCRAEINGTQYNLDASCKYNPFGVLPEECYNGYGRLIAKHGSDIYFDPKDAKENIFFSISTDNNNADNYCITIKYIMGMHTSMKYREEWDGDSSKAKKFVKSFLGNMTNVPELIGYTVDNWNVPERGLSFTIHARIKWSSESMIYTNAFYYKYFGDNPFKSEKREYPVEMPSQLNVTYNCQWQLPAGYVLDDTLPSLNMKYKDDVVYRDNFEYDKKLNAYTIRYNFRLYRNIYNNEEYFGLKEFVDKMLTQQDKILAIKKL